jgi:hypothetical protein
MRLLRLILILIIFAAGAFVWQRTRSHVDSRSVADMPAAVQNVVSGGWWESDSVRGRYRIVEVIEGSEEVRHRVIVQWLTALRSDRGDTVIAALDLNEKASVYGLAGPLIEQSGKEWRVRARSPSGPLRQYADSIRFTLGRPGVATQVP